jgi:CRISPR/Cas system-associated exonuclease Cas4 (RecB family)
MPLPPDFHFSQGSLQDFVDCPRRFQLRYLDRIAWPAVQAEPILENERHLQQGELFHLLVQQHLVGIPVQRLTAMAQGDADLTDWWQAYLAVAPADLPGEHFAEVTLSAPLGASGARRLMAKYDLVVLTPEGRAVIFDWKTSRHRPPRRWLDERLQTRVYSYLLLHAGVDLNHGRPLAAEQIEMVYWFPSFPDRPERFVYSADQATEDESYLHALVEQIVLLADDEGIFPLTPFEERCRFCVYRSLCERGTTAGSLDEVDYRDFEPEIEIVLDFEQVAEVEY